MFVPSLRMIKQMNSSRSFTYLSKAGRLENVFEAPRGAEAVDGHVPGEIDDGEEGAEKDHRSVARRNGQLAGVPVN